MILRSAVVSTDPPWTPGSELYNYLVNPPIKFRPILRVAPIPRQPEPVKLIPVQPQGPIIEINLDIDEALAQRLTAYAQENHVRLVPVQEQNINQPNSNSDNTFDYDSDVVVIN